MATGQRQHPRHQQVADRRKLQPRLVGRHRPRDARRKNMSSRNRQTEHVCGADCTGSDKLGRRSLRVGQMRLADLLADRDHDAPPPDHGAEPERDGNGHLHP